MASEVKMPKMGLTMTTATVGRWLKNEGEPVSRGEAVVEVMTDKITNVIEADADGVLLKIVTPEGTETEASTVLGYVGAPGETVPAGTPAAAPQTTPQAAPEAAPAAPAASASAPTSARTPAPATGGRIKISPLAEKIARDHGLDPSGLTGSGPGGRITRQDVEAALAAPAPAAATAPAAASSATAAPRAGIRESEILEHLPYTGMRKAVGSHMSASARAVPRVTHQTTVPVRRLLDLREQLNRGREKAERLTVTDLLVKITAAALARFPAMNAHLTDTEVLRFAPVHMGVAMAVENGLVVPVVRDADQKSLSAVSREIKELSRKARERTLTESEITGGTFTVSNVGASGSVDHFTPIINLPQVGILGVGRIRQTPWVEDGELTVLPTAALSLTFDHRAVDGAPAAEFLALLNALILDPFNAVV